MIEKLRDIIEQGKKLKKLGSLKRHPLFSELERITDFLPNDCTVSRRLWHAEHDMNVPTCKICDNHAAWDNKNGGFYRMYCSNKCSTSDPDRMKKIQDTNLRRYGSHTPFGSKDIQSKIRNMINVKYGVDNVSQHHDIKKKIKNSLVNTKNKNLNKVDEITNLIDNGSTQIEIGQYLNLSQPRVSSLLKVLNLSTNKTSGSTQQRELVQFVTEISSHSIVLDDVTCIKPYELDILIPEANLAIEFDGVYWHSELSGRGRNYHLNKTKQCNERGIDLIHVLSSEWEYKKDIVKSRLKHRFGMCERVIYARKCEIREIPTAAANEFITDNHIQGPRSARINIGLFYSDELVAVMTFSSHQKYQYEMIRSCSLLNTSVVGAVGKLFNFFKNRCDPHTVLTYADRRWGEGIAYGTIGFIFDGYTQPNYWYFNRGGQTNALHSRLLFQKHKLQCKLDTFDPNKTEWENMSANGYDRIWDCGSSRWIWRQ